MKIRVLELLLFLFLLTLSGCAHVISKDLRRKSDPSLTLSHVRQNPDAFKGKMVVWGGEVIETFNQKDGTTQIEVFQRSIGWRGEPKVTVPSEGRFLILSDQYLDPYLFCKGRKITVAGEILGEKTKAIGEMEYRYPLLSSRQIYLWPEYDYYPYPYYYDPWWPYPYWRFGFGYYYYRPYPYHHRNRR
ncbi:MAG: Slp family lipoprotein [Thermodesulfobacteriota bacterium]